MDNFEAVERRLVKTPIFIESVLEVCESDFNSIMPKHIFESKKKLLNPNLDMIKNFGHAKAVSG
jgi:hypothetical protein